MNRKKILFIARWYPDRHDPMLGLFVQKHAQAVQSLHDVDVLYVTADKTISPGRAQIHHTDFDGIHETRIYFGKHKNEFHNGLAYLKWYIKGLHIVTRYSGTPDISHVHVLSRAAIPALWLKFTSGIPFVITEHWSRYLPENVQKGAYQGLLRKFFTRFAVTASGGVSTVTKNLAQAMIRLGLKNRYVVIPNVADTNLFRPEEIKTPQSIKKLIHVSCFDEPAKNIRGIINAVTQLAHEREDFVLDIVGDGLDFNMVKEHANATGLVDQRIFFHGVLTGELLAKKMREADAMIMFSNYENLPCTIVESICSGVPVISTDVGGIKEHLNKELGILIKAGNEQELKEAVKSVLNNPAAFQPEIIRDYGIGHFSMKKIALQFDELYRSIN